MNQKGFANIVLAVVIVVIMGAVGYFMFVKKSTPANQQPTITNTQNNQTNPKIEGKPTATQPTLTQEQARALVLQTWGGCASDTCGSVTVSVQNNNGQYNVTAIYEGLRDDSLGAQKKVAPAYYNNNVWTLGNATVTQRCQPGRGHQDFSSVPCI